jgi:Protein of unknown function (DUF3551)
MMRVAFVLLAVAAVALIPTSPSIAEVHRPWCADYGHGVNCGFSTYEQCKMTASGTNTWCVQNQWYWQYGPGDERRPIIGSSRRR